MTHFLIAFEWLGIHGLIILILLSSALGMPELLKTRIENQPKIGHHNQGKMYFWDKVLAVWWVTCAAGMLYSIFIPNSIFHI